MTPDYHNAFAGEDPSLRPWAENALAGLSVLAELLVLEPPAVVSVATKVPDLPGGYVVVDSEDEAFLVGFCAPAEVGRELVCRFAGVSATEELVPGFVEDGVAELANALAGLVKKAMSPDGRALNLGLPIYVSGALKSQGVRAACSFEATLGRHSLFVLVQRMALPTEVQERRRLERQVADREARLSAFLHTAASAVITIDGEGRVESCNPAAERLFGRPAEELRGTDVETIAPGWSERVPRREPASLDKVEGIEIEGRRADGSPVPLECSVSWFAGHQTVLQAAIIRDVTARREAAAALERAHRAMASLSRRAGMAEIATDVLHGIGNALNSVQVAAHALRERLQDSRLELLERAVGLLPAGRAELAAFVADDERADRLPELLHALAAELGEERRAQLQESSSILGGLEQIAEIVSRQERFAGDANVVQAVDLLVAVRETVSASDRLGHVVELAVADGADTWVAADHARVVRILGELLANALNACRNGGDRPPVSISLGNPRPGRCAVWVRDNGAVDGEDELRRLFMHEAGGREPSGRNSLHAAVLAAVAMGGALEARALPSGEGVEISFELPCVATGAVAELATGR